MDQYLESTILENFQKGQRRAFNHVFYAYYRQIFHFCNRLIGSEPDADEIASETFSKLFERSKQFNTENNIRAFLYITARNACFNYLRDQKNRPVSYESIEGQLQDLAELQQVKSEVLASVYHQVRKLPGKCKKIFELLYFEELTPVEVAAQLNIDIDTVYSQKRNAIKLLRLALGSVILLFYIFRWFSIR